MHIGGVKMRSYVYDSVKLSNGQRLITRYTLEESLVINCFKLLLFLFIIWPFQLLFWWPIKLIFKGILIVCEFILRTIWWLIRLPFCLLFKHSYPIF